MYDYRRWTAEQRRIVLDERKSLQRPWHGPPHLVMPAGYRILTGTCFEHSSVLNSEKRLAYFEREMLDSIECVGISCAAWVVLPNHYHLLLEVRNIRQVSQVLGKLHGRTSYRFNQEDNSRGRKVWHRCQDRAMRSEAHYFTTLNYIHNNPVKHGYVEKWKDWPFSSFHWYLKNKGRDWLLDLWSEYPVLNYGSKWDE